MKKDRNEDVKQLLIFSNEPEDRAFRWRIFIQAVLFLVIAGVARWFFNQSTTDVEFWGNCFFAFIVFQYFEYRFKRVKQIYSGEAKQGMDSIEDKLDVISASQSEDSGKMKQVIDRLRSIEDKLDALSDA